jgi:23S rRNA pseudouridine1911/1915/1917 synthase
MIKGKTIVQESGGIRLDAALLMAFPSSSRSFIRDAVEDGRILVNGKKTHKGLKLRSGDRVQISELLEKDDNTVQRVSGPKPQIVFEDDFLLAIDKPAGVPVQPLSCRETGTLMNRVVAHYPECQNIGDRPLMAGALHRIDADTSGLVLVARSQEAFDGLRRQFTDQSVEKTYLALVEGSFAAGGTLENDLVHDPTLPYCRMIDKNSRNARSAGMGTARTFHAVTKYRPIQHMTVENEERTLLEVTIFTGVTHQIRAQLAIAGMHIINDRLYGAFAVENQVGHCLHALAAKFRHPQSGDAMEIRTALPPWAQ